MKVAAGKVSKKLKPRSEPDFGLSFGRKFCAQVIKDCELASESEAGGPMSDFSERAKRIFSFRVVKNGEAFVRALVAVMRKFRVCFQIEDRSSKAATVRERKLAELSDYFGGAHSRYFNEKTVQTQAEASDTRFTTGPYHRSLIILSPALAPSSQLRAPHFLPAQRELAQQNPFDQARSLT